MSDELDFRIWNNVAAGRYEMVIRQGNRVAKPLTFRTMNDMEIYTPTLTIPYAQEGWLQSLAEALWREGFRPRDAEIKDGERLALKDNLTDLRKMLEIDR